MADRKISDLTALTTPAAGDYLPIVDISEPSNASKNKRITIEELLRGAPDGTAAAPSIAFESDPDSGLYRAGANQVAISTNGQGRLFINSDGKVGLGTVGPAEKLHIEGAGTQAIRIRNSTTGSAASPQSTFIYFYGHLGAGGVEPRVSIEAQDRRSTQSGGWLNIATANTSNTLVNALHIDNAQRVGIGTTSPTYQLQLSTDSAGKPSTNTWTIVSDERIKEEIELADLDLCYEAVKNIPLKRFKWKDEIYTEEQAYDRRKLGWIAQDVEAVFPKAVRQHEFKYNQVFEEVVIPAVPAELDDDGSIITEEQPERIEKGELISEEVIEDCRDLNSDQLYAAMYGAIQKLISKVETLEAEVAALKG